MTGISSVEIVALVILNFADVVQQRRGNNGNAAVVERQDVEIGRFIVIGTTVFLVLIACCLYCYYLHDFY